MLRFFLLLSCCLFGPASLWAQRQLIGLGAGSNQTDFSHPRLPQQTTASENLIFYYYRYNGPVLDLSHFREFNPQFASEIPAQQPVVMPVLTGGQDTVFGVTYLKPYPNRPGMLVIMVVADYESLHPRFFIDRDHDFDFANDGPPWVFDGQREKHIRFKEAPKPFNRYDFWLLNPNYLPSAPEPTTEAIVLPDIRQKYLEQKEVKLRNLLNLRFEAAVGSGGYRYQYQQPDGRSVAYHVGVSPRGLGLTLTYVLTPFLRAGWAAGGENFYFWSSEKTLDGFIIEKNLSEFPAFRVWTGPVLEGTWNFSSMMSLLPFVRLSRAAFLPGKFFPSSVNRDQSFAVQAEWMYEAGLGSEFRIAKNQAIVASFSYLRSDMGLDTYLQQPGRRGLSSHFQQGRFSVGYQVGLW